MGLLKNAAKKEDRWVALEPVRLGMRRHFGGFTPKDYAISHPECG
jgi:hypothetical protein